MNDIQPYFKWREKYIASEDPRSPFYNVVNNEFQYTYKIYNYWIHPQWNYFGSDTLYLKVLYTDYDKKYAIIEFIGEWNDCLHNDIMHLKREVIEAIMKEDISKFVLICDNVLNFHGSDDSYYEEWREEVSEEGGWICVLNARKHIRDEMQNTGLQHYLYFDDATDDIIWQSKTPEQLLLLIEDLMNRQTKQLYY